MDSTRVACAHDVAWHVRSNLHVEEDMAGRSRWNSSPQRRSRRPSTYTTQDEPDTLDYANQPHR